jgi:hypothetical protein
LNVYHNTMFPSIVSTLERKSKIRKRSVLKSEKLEYLRETSPDIFEECFEDHEDYIKTKLDIDTSLPLLTAFGNSVSTC